jgi:hypothetical protein
MLRVLNEVLINLNLFINLMKIQLVLGIVIIMITLGATTTVLTLQPSFAATSRAALPASSVTSGENVYIVWASNKTGTPDVMFRASTDAGQTYNDKINLSNSSNADSTDAAISAEGGSITVTWWETNETSEEPLVRTSTDFGKSFGPIMNLATNGTMSEAEEEPEE